MLFRSYYYLSLCLENKESLRETAFEQIKEKDPLCLVGDGRRKTLASDHVPSTALVLQQGLFVQLQLDFSCKVFIEFVFLGSIVNKSDCLFLLCPWHV